MEQEKLEELLFNFFFCLANFIRQKSLKVVCIVCTLGQQLDNVRTTVLCFASFHLQVKIMTEMRPNARVMVSHTYRLSSRNFVKGGEGVYFKHTIHVQT